MPSRTPSNKRAISIATRSSGMVPSSWAALIERWKKASISASRSCNEFAQLLVVRRYLKRRIDQKTAPPFAIVHRALDDLLDETADSLFRRQESSSRLIRARVE